MSSPSKAPEKASKASDKDTLLFFHVLLNLNNSKTPDLSTLPNTTLLYTDWEKVAAAMNLKNVAVAKARYNQVRKKLMEANGMAAASALATPKRATPSKRKTAKAKLQEDNRSNPDDDDDEFGFGDIGESPTKKQKIKPEPKENEDDEEYF